MWMLGYLSRPMSSGQRRMELAEDRAVSLSMPTLTQPALAAISLTPQMIALPSSLSAKSSSFTLSD
jgi:hypothetical protein